MDITAYTRGYNHGIDTVDRYISDQVDQNESYDEIMARYDDEAEKMQEQGFPEDYVDGYADGYEQRLKEYEDGVEVGNAVAG